MRRILVLVGLLGLAFAAQGAADDAADRVKPGFFFGRIAFENEVIGVDIRGGRVRAFVTDAEPGGTAESFEGRVRAERMRLVSTSGRSRLRASLEHGHGDWLGTITLPCGRTRNFAVTLAEFGAGIYRISVSSDGRYQGRSLDGKRLRASTRGSSRGHDHRAQRRLADVSHHGPLPCLRLLTPERRAAGQLRRDRVAQGTLVYGRSGVGALERGRPGRQLLAPDVAPSAGPTPGFYFGKVAFSRAVIGVQVHPPDAAAPVASTSTPPTRSRSPEA